MQDNPVMCPVERRAGDVLNELAGKVLKMVGEVLNEDVDMDSSVTNIAAWDSLAYMAIVASIEDEFGLEIREHNINNFTSIRKIIKEIENGKG